MSKGGKIAKAKQNPPKATTVIPLEKLQLMKKRPLTKKRQKLFLAEYAKTFNVSKAAYAAGISSSVVYRAFKADEEFKNAFDEIKQAKLHVLEEVSLRVGSQVDARGFNDRKLLLQAYMPEIYNPKTQIEINQTLTINNANQKAAQVFQSIFAASGKIEDAEVIEELPENDLEQQKEKNGKALANPKSKENK